MRSEADSQVVYISKACGIVVNRQQLLFCLSKKG